MIAYFDSSSTVKWFFDEPYMDLARTIRHDTKIAFTSLLSFPEVMSAIYRAWREGRCSKSDMELVRGELLHIWPDFQWIKVSERLMRQAGDLIFKHSLRGYDGVHLASALLLKEDGDSIDLFFSYFDRNLNRAAKKEGLRVNDTPVIQMICTMRSPG